MLAIVLVYALLVVLFQSWVDPFIIMMAVPGALIGILWMLALTGTTINVMSLMGAIMAVGIAVSNSILVVSFANDLRVAQSGHGAVRGRDRGRQDAAAPGADDGAGDDHRHGADGARPGRGRRAERAARPRRDRRAVVATISTLFVVPVIYTLLRRGTPTLHTLDARFAAEARGEST